MNTINEQFTPIRHNHITEQAMVADDKAKKRYRTERDRSRRDSEKIWNDYDLVTKELKRRQLNYIWHQVNPSQWELKLNTNAECLIEYTLKKLKEAIAADLVKQPVALNTGEGWCLQWGGEYDEGQPMDWPFGEHIIFGEDLVKLGFIVL